MHEQFTRDVEDKDKDNTWRWMRKSDLKGGFDMKCPGTVYTDELYQVQY